MTTITKRLITLLLLHLCLIVRAVQGGPTSQPSPVIDKAALTTACEDVLRSAVRTGYGLGWADAEAADKGPAKGSTKPKPINARETALIALQLHWAGEFLENDEFRQAAFDAARGLSAIQLPTGQVRDKGLLIPGGGPKAPLADVPERADTTAALGLWLMLIDASDQKARAAANTSDKPPARDERLVRPAAAAARWLASQQTPAGAWPAAYPADAPRGKAQRIIQLDTPGYRDASLALLLAGEVLDNRDFRFAFEKSLDQLVFFRLPCAREGNRGPTLWASAYTPAGDPARKLPTYVDGIDLQASRYAMEVCAWAYLVTLKPKGNAPLREACLAIATLPKEKGTWRRYFDRVGDPINPAEPPKPEQPAPSNGKLFPDPEQTTSDASTFSLPPILALSDQLEKAGADRTAKGLAATSPLRTRIVETFTGLTDEGLAMGSTPPRSGVSGTLSARVAAIRSQLRPTVERQP